MDQIISYLTRAWIWIYTHPEWSIPLALYIAANIVPRTPPENATLLSLWRLAERLMVLSWDRWGGRLKALGVVYPILLDDEPPTKPDSKTIPPRSP